MFCRLKAAFAESVLPVKLHSKKVVFLHGSPAVGKLTTAKALLRFVPARLMDNHGSGISTARPDWVAR
jgi:hypothetical protein